MARETGQNGGNSFDTNRRGFLGSTGLAAMGAIVGSAPEFRAPTHRRHRLPRPPRRRDRNT